MENHPRKALCHESKRDDRKRDLDRGKPGLLGIITNQKDRGAGGVSDGQQTCEPNEILRAPLGFRRFYLGAIRGKEVQSESSDREKNRGELQSLIGCTPDRLGA